MLDIETKYGCFGHFKDLYKFMLENNLQKIEIIKISYCLDEVLRAGTYTLEQIKEIIENK